MIGRWEPLGIFADTEYCAHEESVDIEQGGNIFCLTKEELVKLLEKIEECKNERIKNTARRESLQR